MSKAFCKEGLSGPDTPRGVFGHFLTAAVRFTAAAANAVPTWDLLPAASTFGRSCTSTALATGAAPSEGTGHGSAAPQVTPTPAPRHDTRHRPGDGADGRETTTASFVPHAAVGHETAVWQATDGRQTTTVSSTPVITDGRQTTTVMLTPFTTDGRPTTTVHATTSPTDGRQTTTVCSSVRPTDGRETTTVPSVPPTLPPAMVLLCGTVRDILFDSLGPTAAAPPDGRQTTTGAGHADHRMGAQGMPIEGPTFWDWAAELLVKDAGTSGDMTRAQAVKQARQIQAMLDLPPTSKGRPVLRGAPVAITVCPVGAHLPIRAHIATSAVEGHGIDIALGGSVQSAGQNCCAVASVAVVAATVLHMDIAAARVLVHVHGAALRR